MNYALGPLLERRRRKPKPSLEAAAVLAAARSAQVDVQAAEARKLAAAVEWARLHEVTDPDDAATWGDLGRQPDHPGWRGCPVDRARLRR